MIANKNIEVEEREGGKYINVLNSHISLHKAESPSKVNLSNNRNEVLYVKF